MRLFSYNGKYMTPKVFYSLTPDDSSGMLAYLTAGIIKTMAMRFRIEAWLSSPDFYRDIKKNVRNVSRVIKACLRLYISCPQFKTQVDEYIREHKDRII